jgi:hypothetical protein
VVVAGVFDRLQRVPQGDEQFVGHLREALVVAGGDRQEGGDQIEAGLRA